MNHTKRNKKIERSLLGTSVVTTTDYTILLSNNPHLL